MEPRSLVPLFLFLHIGAAIIAFGPTYSFAIIGRMGGRDPAHANFATRVGYAIVTQRVLPVAVAVGITGLGLIWAAGWDLSRQVWLVVAIALYLVALGLSWFVALPNMRRLIAATAGGPPPIVGERPPGPPPAEIMAMVRRSQLTGLALMVLVLVILTLMVFKPTF